MKKLVILLVICLFGNNLIFAQVAPPENKPDAELTKKEAEFRIQQFQERVKSLENQLNSLNQKHESLKADLERINKDLQDCNDEILKLIGATRADIEAFRQRLGVIEGKVRELQRLNDEQLLKRQDEVKRLEEDLNDLRGNKLSILPEFYPRIIQLAKDIRGLYREPKEITYTVGTWAENRDCLWNIAGKIEIYADPFMWPRIWQANTDQIRNPDLIYPGQVLKIPTKGPKTSEEIKAERKYWRNKKAQENQVQPGGTN